MLTGLRAREPWESFPPEWDSFFTVIYKRLPQVVAALAWNLYMVSLSVAKMISSSSTAVYTSLALHTFRDRKSICTGPVFLEQQRNSKKNSPDSLPLSSASHMTLKSSKQHYKASRPRARANRGKGDKSRSKHKRQQKGAITCFTLP